MAKPPKREGKTALLIYCTREEADLVRRNAKLERRTISGYVMMAVANRLQIQDRLRKGQEGGRPGTNEEGDLLRWNSLRPPRMP